MTLNAAKIRVSFEEAGWVQLYVGMTCVGSIIGTVLLSGHSVQ